MSQPGAQDASPGDSVDRETVEITAAAIRGYEFTGRVLLRVEAPSGAPPRAFTLNGVSLSTTKALLDFDGEADPPVLRIRDGALRVHGPVSAAPGVTLHGVAGFIVLRPGQRLVLAPDGLKVENTAEPPMQPPTE